LQRGTHEHAQALIGGPDPNPASRYDGHWCSHRRCRKMIGRAARTMKGNRR
jgi:hypothetical protein